MRKLVAVLILAAGVAGCDVASVLIDGIKKTKAVGADLEEVTGLKPEVGFNWNNGQLVNVSVVFPRLYDAKPLRELAEATRKAVLKEFERTPQRIVLSFTVDPSWPIQPDQNPTESLKRGASAATSREMKP
jgi:hypothetical protein